MRKLIVYPALGIFLCLSFFACARQSDESRRNNRTAVTEAYTLLDRGESGRAIRLLERVVFEEPANSEARLVLASAYMGKAGIDVLSIHDAFKDVLFSRSLSEVFTTGAEAKPVTGELPAGEQSKNDTPVEKLLQTVDGFLNTLRRVTVIFNRFPHVEDKNWPLLDQALLHLDQIDSVNEVRVYRLFVRMIYLKEYLVKNIIKDASFGSRAWGCRLDLDTLRENMGWVMGLLARASEDFVFIFPGEPSPFIRAHTVFKLFEDEIGQMNRNTPVGTETGVNMAQRRFREALRCTPQ